MIFTKKEIIFYKTYNDLSYKINKYKKDKERKKIAKNGTDIYLKYLNSTLLLILFFQKLLIIEVKINLFGKSKLIKHMNRYLIFRTDRIGDF